MLFACLELLIDFRVEHKQTVRQTSRQSSLCTDLIFVQYMYVYTHIPMNNIIIPLQVVFPFFRLYFFPTQIVALRLL